VQKTALFFGGASSGAPDQVVYTPDRLYPVGDLNGDGHADAVMIAGRTLRVFRGTEAGYQATGVTRSLASEFVGSVRGFADLDGDQTADAVLGHLYADGAVDVVMGSDRLEGVEVRRDTLAYDGAGGVAYATGDLTGDGSGEVVQLAGGDGESTTVRVATAGGDGRLTVRQQFSTGDLEGRARRSRVWAVDVTGSGTLELLVKASLFGASTWAFRADGPAALAPAPVRLAAATGKDDAVPIGDLNGDGRHDFYTADESSRTRYVSYGPASLSDGLSFDAAIPYADTEAGDPRYLPRGRIGDVRGGGADDAVLGIYDNPNHRVGRRTVSVEGGRVDTADVTYAERSIYDRVVSTRVVGDVGGSPEPDLAVVRLDRDVVEVFFGGDGFGGEPDATLRGNGALYPYDVAAGDFNGDGAQDVVVAYYGATRAASRLAVHLGGEAFGGLPERSIAFDAAAPPGFSGGFETPTNVGDVNGDGTDDLMAAAPFSQNAQGGFLNRAYLYFGGPGFAETSAPDATLDARGRLGTRYVGLGRAMAGLGDVNADGTDDLAIAAPAADEGGGAHGRVMVYFGRESGGPAFGDGPDRLLRPRGTEDGFGHSILGAVNLNGDGVRDVAVAAERFSTVNSTNRPVYIYHGGPDFDAVADQRLAPPQAALFGPDAADYNGDGRIDRNTGALAAIPDVNADGRDELLWASGSAHTHAVVYFGGEASAPRGLFLAPNRDASLGGPVAAAVGDVDGNGEPDYLLAQRRDDNAAAASSRVYRYRAESLPVNLARLRATVSGEDAVVLRWATASETQNARFEVQHRPPAGAAFSTIGTRGGAGTSAEPRRYRFRAAGLAPGEHAFRLRQVDADGTTSLSRVVRATVPLRASHRLTRPAPNPTAGPARLVLRVRRAQTATVALYDPLGRRVRTLHRGPVRPASPLRVTVEAGDLSSGTYLVRVVGEAFTAVRRLTVVR
jgi:hypothetical protein